MIKKYGVILFWNLALMELCAIMFVYSAGILRPDWRLDFLLDKHLNSIDSAYIEKVRPRHSPLLGWDNLPSSQRTSMNTAGEPWTESYDADGARNHGNNSASAPPTIMTFGDSYTQGSEVNDDQTWPYYLEKAASVGVKNFGVGGHGVGQAYLKVKNKYENGFSSKITIFAIYTADLNRAANSYRPFMTWNDTEKLAFKPNFRYIDNRIQFNPNPFTDISKPIEEIRDLIYELAEDEYWFSQHLYVDTKFPFTLQGAKVLSHLYRKIDNKLKNKKPSGHLWQTTEGEEIMKYILANFSKTAKENGSIPVVLFIPNVRRWKDGRQPPLYNKFTTEVLPKALPDLAVIDVSNAEFDEEKFNILAYNGHASPYGNKVIGDYVAKKLKHMGYLQ